MIPVFFQIINAFNISRQEGVKHNLYNPLTVEVECPDGKKRTCRVYQQTNKPIITNKIEDLPDERKPSYVYLKTILDGANESDLPQHYIEFLKKIPHNGYKGEVDIGLDLQIIN